MLSNTNTVTLQENSIFIKLTLFTFKISPQQNCIQSMQKVILGVLLLAIAHTFAFKQCEPFGPRLFYGATIKDSSSSEKAIVYFNTISSCQSSYLQLIKKSGAVKVDCSTTPLSLSNNTGYYQTYVHKCKTNNINFEETFQYNVLGWDGISPNPTPYKDFVNVKLADPFNSRRKTNWIVLADWSKVEVNSYKYTVIDPFLLQLQAQEEIDGILILGDIGYDLDTNNCSNYEKFLVELSETVASLPIILVTGNHQYNTPDNWKLYAESFELYGLDSELAISLTLSSFQMIAFDPYNLLYSAPSPQTDLVAAKFSDLIQKAKKSDRFILPTSHYPLACSGSSKNCAKDRQFMKEYWNLMLDNNLSFYLGAHYHTYQRLYPYQKGDKFIKQEGGYVSDGGYLITIIEGVAGNDKDIVENIDKIEDFTASYTISQTGFGIMEVSTDNLRYRHFSTIKGQTDRMDLKINGVQKRSPLKFLSTQ